MVGMPTLEVIATSIEDALAAERGGADRLEVVAAMAADGLLPDVDVVRQLRDAVGLPLRVMLRSRPGFATDAQELAVLCRAAERLCERAAWQTATLRWLAGGGLRLEHLPALWAAGITQFHSGRAVRRGGSWERPVEEAMVQRWKTALLQASRQT